MKIKEIAHKLNISPRAIRFYEECGLITPDRLADNQYRSYSEKDAWRLQTIIALREVGMTTAAIKKVLGKIENEDKHEIEYLLDIQRSAMFTQWIELKQIIQTLDQMVDHLKQDRSLTAEDMYMLAEGSKRLRVQRAQWKDRWNFDQKAAAYDENIYDTHQDFMNHAQYEAALEQTMEWISPVSGETGLEIGVGTGNLSGRFLALGHHMVGIDQSREMLKQCRQKHPQLETKVGNFLAIPFFDDQFDFIVSSFAFHHLTPEQQALALEEMNRVIKPHGRLCLTDIMFESQEERLSFLNELEQTNQQDRIHKMDGKCYAEIPALRKQLDDIGYISQKVQVHSFIHLVAAVRIR